MRSRSVPELVEKYRVLVVKNEGAKEPHQRVTAICLEENLVGRGPTPTRAMVDLSAVLLESFAYWRDNLVPPIESDPDPDLAHAFESKLPLSPEGDLVLGRFDMVIQYGLAADRPKRAKPQVTYQKCLV